jgi:hypothetical protein
MNAKRSAAASRRALRSKSTTTNSAMRGFLLSVLRRISPLSTLSNRGTRYLGIIHPPLPIDCRRIIKTAPEEKVGAPKEHLIIGPSPCMLRKVVRGAYMGVRQADPCSKLYSPNCRELRDSRKPIYSLANPYPIGPELSAVSRPDSNGGHIICSALG